MLVIVDIVKETFKNTDKRTEDNTIRSWITTKVNNVSRIKPENSANQKPESSATN